MKYKNKKLYIENVSIEKLAKKYGTPLYCYSFNKIKGGLPSVNVIIEDIEKADNDKTSSNLIVKEKTIFKKDIIFENVSFSYKDINKSSLNDVSFKISKGSIVGISGDSGSGKSTLLHLLIGLITPSKGRITMDDIDISKNFETLKSNFGYVSQQTILFDDKISFNITLKENLEKLDNERFNEVLNIVNLSKFVNNLDEKADTVIGEKALKISGGQKQRIVIARAIYCKPEIIIFDEATSELDKENETNIFKNIFDLNKGKTVIFITHNKKLLELCNIEINVKNGKVKVLKKGQNSNV